MINVCLATDMNYVHYTMMCIYDIVIRKDPSTELTFYVLVDRLTDEEINQIHQLDGLPQTTIVTIRVDSTEIVPNYQPIGHLSSTSYLRIIIPDMPEFEHIDRLLWLDSDVLCRRDITDLYNMDLKGKPLGATKGAILLGYYDPETVSWKYSDINSGVLLMDLNKLREMEYGKLMRYGMHEKHGLTFEGTLWYVMKNHITLLPPKVQVPYHNFVRNRFNTKAFCDINRWNQYYDTNYDSFQELLDEVYFFHFHEEKDRYLLCPHIKAIYRLCEKRLADYLSTGKVMAWTPDDDREVLLPCEDMIHNAEELVHQSVVAFAEAERQRRGSDSPEVTEWTFFFDKIYCMRSRDLSTRSLPVYQEMIRVGMVKTKLVENHMFFRGPFDSLIYNTLNHEAFDVQIGNSDPLKKLNQTMAYYHLFQQILCTGIKKVLICEDDVVFRKSTREIRDMFDHLPSNWDYIKFERVNGPESIQKYQSSMTQGEWYHKNYTGGYLGTACCAYSRRAIELAVKIIEGCELVSMNYLLENRDDERLNDLHRYVSSKNLVMEAGKEEGNYYTGISEPSEFWSTAEFKRIAGGQL